MLLGAKKIHVTIIMPFKKIKYNTEYTNLWFPCMQLSFLTLI